MKTARLTVVTANVGRGVAAAEAAANIRRTVNGFRPTAWRRNPAAIGWQEIDEADQPDEHGLLHRTVKALTPGAEYAGNWTAVPIVIPKGWSLLDQRSDITCPGRPKVTPHRVCVQALVEDDRSGLRIVLMNGHYPHNAWDLWKVCQRNWEALVDGWNDQGYTCVTTRDRNKRGNTEPLSPWEVSLLAPQLLDKITVIQARPGARSVRVIPGKPRTVRLSIDGHDAHGVPLTFTSLPKGP